MKNSKQKQWLSFLLALIMLVGLLPFSVLFTFRASAAAVSAD